MCHYTATLKCTKMSKRIYVRLGVMKSSIKSKQAKVGRAKAKQAMGWPPLAQSNSLSGYLASAVKTGGHLLSETPSPGILVDTKLSRGKNNILVLDELRWAGLGWARLGRAQGAGRWAKLGYAKLSLAWLGWAKLAGLRWADLDWARLGWAGLARLGWAELSWARLG